MSYNCYIISSPSTRCPHKLIYRGCEKVVSLITAFRDEDQIIAVLPYFAHVDFKVIAIIVHSNTSGVLSEIINERN